LEALRGNDRRWTVRTVGGQAKGLSGPIDEIGYLLDPNQRTAVVKGYIDNPGDRIRGGQYVTVTVNIPPPDDVVEIPTDAVVEDGRQSVVFVQSDPAGGQFTKRRVQVTHRFDGKVFVRKTPIPKDEQLTAEEAAQGLLPKEPLRPGERVRLGGAPEQPVEDRLSALERKLDQVLEALRALRPPAATKSDPHERDVPK
jgi:cobalt-zinc-cadmium efflux system membrane fusion protein